MRMIKKFRDYAHQGVWYVSDAEMVAIENDIVWAHSELDRIYELCDEPIVHTHKILAEVHRVCQLKFDKVNEATEFLSKTTMEQDVHVEGARYDNIIVEPHLGAFCTVVYVTKPRKKDPYIVRMNIFWQPGEKMQIIQVLRQSIIEEINGSEHLWHYRREQN